MWNQRYSEPGFAYGTDPNDFLAANAERYLSPNGESLCLAEGEGRNAVFLARRGVRVTEQHGVDIQTVVADLGDFDLGVDHGTA